MIMRRSFEYLELVLVWEVAAQIYFEQVSLTVDLEEIEELVTGIEMLN